MKKQINYLIDQLIEKDKEIKQLKEVVMGLKQENEFSKKAETILRQELNNQVEDK